MTAPLSPLPWRQKTICSTSVADEDGNVLAMFQMVSDMNYVLTVVNSHAALVEALKRARATIVDFGEDTMCNVDEDTTKIDAALKLAEGAE